MLKLKCLILSWSIGINGFIVGGTIVIAYLSFFKFEPPNSYYALTIYVFISLQVLLMQMLFRERWLHQLILTNENDKITKARSVIVRRFRNKPRNALMIFKQPAESIQETYVDALKEIFLPETGAFHPPPQEFLSKLADTILKTGSSAVKVKIITLIKNILSEQRWKPENAEKAYIIIKLHETLEEHSKNPVSENRELVHIVLDTLILFDLDSLSNSNSFLESLAREVDEKSKTVPGDLERLLLEQFYDELKEYNNKIAGIIMKKINKRRESYGY